MTCLTSALSLGHSVYAACLWNLGYRIPGLENLCPEGLVKKKDNERVVVYLRTP